jgi:hypothetical protein
MHSSLIWNIQTKNPRPTTFTLFCTRWSVSMKVRCVYTYFKPGSSLLPIYKSAKCQISIIAQRCRYLLIRTGILYESFQWQYTQIAINSNTWVKAQFQYLWEEIYKIPLIIWIFLHSGNDTIWTHNILRHFRSSNYSEFLVVFVGVSHCLLHRRRAPSSLLRRDCFFPCRTDAKRTAFQGVSGVAKWRIVQIGCNTWFGSRSISSKRINIVIVHVKYMGKIMVLSSSKMKNCYSYKQWNNYQQT